jgi:hypothetical protein
MKKLALVLGVAVAVVLTSCGHDPAVDVSDRLQINGESGIRVVKFEGHEYLAYDMQRGGSLCHSESCPCKSK